MATKRTVVIVPDRKTCPTEEPVEIIPFCTSRDDGEHHASPWGPRCIYCGKIVDRED